MIRTAFLTLALAAPLAHAADLVVHVDNVQSAKGQVMVALYDNAGDFLKRPVRGMAARADAAGTKVVFHDVAPGTYGIAVFHDVNDNGSLDMDPTGTPLEPFAFGNNAPAIGGAPAFDAVKLTVPAAGLDTTVTLQTLR